MQIRIKEINEIMELNKIYNVFNYKELINACEDNMEIRFLF